MRITRTARVHVAGTLPETTGRRVGKQLYRVPPSIRLNEAAVHAAKKLLARLTRLRYVTNQKEM
jgi:hypothetical protein